MWKWMGIWDSSLASADSSARSPLPTSQGAICRFACARGCLHQSFRWMRFYGTRYMSLCSACLVADTISNGHPDGSG